MSISKNVISHGNRKERNIMMKKITSLNDMPVILDVDLIQQIMGISRTKAYKLVKSDGFPRIKIGKRIGIPKEAFEEWLHNRTEY